MQCERILWTIEKCIVGLKNFGLVILQSEPLGKSTLSENSNAMKALVETNPTVSTRELAARMDVKHTTILQHLSEIGKGKNIRHLYNKISFWKLYWRKWSILWSNKQLLKNICSLKYSLKNHTHQPISTILAW